MGNDRHFLGKAFDVVGLFLEKRKRNKHRKVAVVMPGFSELFVKDVADVFPNAVTPRLDHHAARRNRVFRHFGGGDDVLIPFGVVCFSGVFQCHFSLFLVRWFNFLCKTT